MTHVAVILAAGGSTRLGRPKQLLTREGETLVHRAARMALATAPTRVLIVLGADADELTRAVADLPCEIVANDHWNHGLAGSIAAAGRALGACDDVVLLLGCDQPRLGIEHLHALLNAAAPTGIAASGYRGVVGIPAVVPPGWLGDIATGDRGLGARLRALSSAALGVVDAPELENDVDTPAQLAAAVTAGWIDADG